MTNFIIGETCGMEIESDSIFPRRLRKLPNGFTLVQDASVETNSVQNINYVKVEGPIQELFPTATLGTEIVSTNPLYLNEEVIPIISKVIGAVIAAGEIGTSKRSSIHFHITLPPNLRIVKEVINMGAYLEDLFFLIGGMGYAFRGIYNDSTYCRPITKYGPQCVRKNTGRSYSQVFNIDDLLASKSLEDFQYRYGDIISQRGNKYIPVRYSWLNIYSMFTRGSLEFRSFNFTSNAAYIYAAMRLSGYFVQRVLQRSFSGEYFERLPENSIYDKRSKNEIIKTFNSFFDNIDEVTRSIILDIIEYTPEVILEPEYIFSHLMYHAHGDKTDTHFKGEYSPPTINRNYIKVPKFQDRHNIGG